MILSNNRVNLSSSHPASVHRAPRSQTLRHKVVSRTAQNTLSPPTLAPEDIRTLGNSELRVSWSTADHEMVHAGAVKMAPVVAVCLHLANFLWPRRCHVWALALGNGEISEFGQDHCVHKSRGEARTVKSKAYRELGSRAIIGELGTGSLNFSREFEVLREAPSLPQRLHK
eukprot:scaffold75568_cov17-Tisochrysis_lutea.AAC.2